MKTTNKVQTGDTVTGTSTSTTASQWQTYNAEQGWECPRCGRINAPWIKQCSCTPSWNKITVNPCNDWWTTTVTYDDNMFRIHPDTTTFTTDVNTIAGGSDYKDSVTGAWVNVPKTHTNSVKR